MSSPIRFAHRMTGLKSSPIREILAAAQQSSVISFAGGLPATELLPTMEGWVPPATAGQYGPSEGEPELRQQVVEILQKRGLTVTSDQVLITAGSQQGIDLTAKLLLDPGDTVALESPSYLAALQVFSLFQANFSDLGSSAEQLNFAQVERVLQANPKFSYLVPTFQNPTGYAYSADERSQMANMLDKYQIPLLEDEPYRELDYASDTAHVPIAAQLRQAPWLYQGTFSKVLLPGLRIGYITASQEFMPSLIRLKQAADLHTQRMGQHWVSQWLSSGKQPAHVDNLVVQYRQRRNAMQIELERHFGAIASWREPKGGLFFWLKLHEPQDTRLFLKAALEAGVAFMPGEPFFGHGDEKMGYFRLNFSHSDPAQIATGLARLKKVFEQGPRSI